MTTKAPARRAAKPSSAGLDDEARYSVQLHRVARMRATTFRPGEEHVMTGALIKRLAAAEGCAPDELGAIEPVAD